MTKGVSVQEVIKSGDPERIHDKMVGLLRDVDDGMGMPITIYCAQVCQAELARQAVEKVEKSSKRLERLTTVLIVLTVVLLIVAVPPAIEAVAHWLGR